MSTTPSNNGAGKKGAGFAWAIDTSGSNDINQGDLLYFDTSAHVAKPLDSDAHAAFLLGVAYDSSFLNLYGTKIYEAAVVAVCDGVSRMKTTSGDTYHDGDTLYLGADAQTVTNTAGGNTHPVGNVHLPFGNTVAGGANILIECIILAQFPGTGVA